jgi:hypothetical protein
MLKQLFDVKEMIEKKYAYYVTHNKDEATSHELLQVSMSPDEIPFMTFTYNKSDDCLYINTELQYPDTFTIAEISLDCMRMYNTRMGKPFLIIPTEDGKSDVLYGNDAYDYIADRIEEMANEEDEESDFFISKHKDKPKTDKGSMH